MLSIGEDKSGTLWLGTWDGVCSFDKQTETFEPLRLSPQSEDAAARGPVFAVLPAEAHSLWLAGQTGDIQRVDLGAGTVKHFSDPEGSAVGLVYSLLQDDMGRIWFSTQASLSSLDPETGVFSSFAQQDGIEVTSFSAGAYDSGVDGELLFGGSN